MVVYRRISEAVFVIYLLVWGGLNIISRYYVVCSPFSVGAGTERSWAVELSLGNYGKLAKCQQITIYGLSGDGELFETVFE